MLRKPYRSLPGLFLVLVLLLTPVACKLPTVTGNLPAAVKLNTMIPLIKYLCHFLFSRLSPTLPFYPSVRSPISLRGAFPAYVSRAPR